MVQVTIGVYAYSKASFLLILIFQEKIFLWQQIKIETRNLLTGPKRTTITGMVDQLANQGKVMNLCTGHSKGTMKR